ncbi:MAG: hypothetical protein ABWZ57_15470 [Mesorhizobium sp.]
MAVKQPIETAPKDGSKVKVYWTDSLGQENESVARFRSLESLRKSGGEWDETDAGWWTFVDSDTQKRIDPHAWSTGQEEDE